MKALKAHYQPLIEAKEQKRAEFQHQKRELEDFIDGLKEKQEEEKRIKEDAVMQ